MSGQLNFLADVQFSVREPSGDVMSGTVTAAGTEILVHIAEIGSSSIIPSLRQVREVAGYLAGNGLSVVIEGSDGPIISLGALRQSRPRWFAKGSSNIRLGSLKVLSNLVRFGKSSRKSDFSLFPPETLVPLFPTIRRQVRHQVTTTHNSRGSGRPRLIFVRNSQQWEGQVPREFNLSGDRITIGSGPEVDLQLPGLEDFHAEIVHDDRDEYVLVQHGVVTGSVGPGREAILRTGARIQMGQWCLAYFREEFADHGRPFGGRNGGELAYQRPQVDPRSGFIESDGSTWIR